MKEKFRIKNFIFLFLAGIVNGFGVTIFLYPAKVYDGGISGLSMFINQLTPEYLTLALFLLVLNIPIFIYGLKKQGYVFTIYSIFSVIIYSLTSFLITNVIPVDVVTASPLAGDDLLLCAVFGGTLSGIGSGLVIKFGGALDGIEVLSVIFAKKIGITVGNFVLIFNLILYIICGLVIQSWILPLYSIIAYFINSKMVDFIVYGFNKSKCAMIVSSKPDEISQALSKQFEASGTIVDAIGAYSKEKKGIIYFVVNQFEINKMKNIIHEIDKFAFVSLHEVSDIIKYEPKVLEKENKKQKENNIN